MAHNADTVARYLAVWNETDAARRRELIARTWTEDAHYVDPLMQGDGYTSIDAFVQGVQQQFPGYRFRQVGVVDGHHSYVRFAWELGPARLPAPIAGSDVAILADDGRMRRVIGFLDRVPAAPLKSDRKLRRDGLWNASAMAPQSTHGITYTAGMFGRHLPAVSPATEGTCPLDRGVFCA